MRFCTDWETRSYKRWVCQQLNFFCRRRMLFLLRTNVRCWHWYFIGYYRCWVLFGCLNLLSSSCWDRIGLLAGDKSQKRSTWRPGWGKFMEPLNSGTWPKILTWMVQVILKIRTPEQSNNQQSMTQAKTKSELKVPRTILWQLEIRTQMLSTRTKLTRKASLENYLMNELTICCSSCQHSLDESWPNRSANLWTRLFWIIFREPFIPTCG